MRKVLILIGILTLAQPAMAWDFTKHSIPLDDILSGGPPRDGIPALLDPQFISAKKAADSLKPGDKVIGRKSQGLSHPHTDLSRTGQRPDRGYSTPGQLVTPFCRGRRVRPDREG